MKQNYFIGVKCSLIEKTIIRQKARMVGLTLSEYLRECGLKGQAVSNKKVLPKQVLQFTGTLNHLAANLNQIARKRNSMNELNALERVQLEFEQKIRSLKYDVIKGRGIAFWDDKKVYTKGSEVGFSMTILEKIWR